ncbi:UNVERIFIED_CONTAM: hypothetical protein GTU68_042382 [Idotea baltica]|nr:hypothetical protein [Idotea baltica]
MIAIAARPLGISCKVVDPSKDAPAASVAEHICADYSDPIAITKLVDEIDFLTFEFENVPAAALKHVPSTLSVSPPIEALQSSQDRLQEKQLFNSLGIGTTEYRAVSSANEIEAAAKELGYPCILKTRRLGYDGKGQSVLKSEADIPTALDQIESRELILEAFFPFDRELSIIGVRSDTGEIRCYPLVENIHRGGILRTTIAPAAEVSATTKQKAEEYFGTLAEHLSYVGVFCIELFVKDDLIVANEFAPRVHNSGHWSIEGTSCSQFENHARAVCKQPLGQTSVKTPSVMVNIIGEFPSKEELSRVDGVYIHDYGKAPRTGRKLGHATICDSDAEELQRKRKVLEAICN